MTIDQLLNTSTPMALHKKVVLNLLYTQTQVVEILADVFKSFDISQEQFNVLRILRGQKGKPANMCLIQERMLAKTSNTTRLVDKLLLKDYVTREVCPDNRRKIEVMITQKGLDILTQIDPKVEQCEQSIASNFTEIELHTLNHLLDKIRNH